MTVEKRVSVNIGGVIYRQENDRVFVNEREVIGIEAEHVKQTIATTQRGVREHIGKVRDYVRSIWR